MKVKRAKAPGLDSDLDNPGASTDEAVTGDVQVLILQQLRKVNICLDAVEVAGVAGSTSARRKDWTKLSKVKKMGHQSLVNCVLVIHLRMNLNYSHCQTSDQIGVYNIKLMLE